MIPLRTFWLGLAVFCAVAISVFYIIIWQVFDLPDVPMRVGLGAGLLVGLLVLGPLFWLLDRRI